MGVRSFLSSCSRLLKTARKPSRSELWLSLKICTLGMVAVGGIGFIIAFISFLLGAPTQVTQT
ncbi:protein translocase SEC61 complex subunit gamma [Candidatus Bathyarchaeota archaeon]|nr:protein translocase SEC61 complex subunit gamma [Candidatus Bathyarchaeota archaeon]